MNIQANWSVEMRGFADGTASILFSAKNVKLWPKLIEKCILCQSNEKPAHSLVHTECCCSDHVRIFEKVKSVLKTLIMYLNLIIMHKII